ncbi:MAG: valine--tRNA ligase [Candidatus Zixiibacteriota bacterium]|nr:MAG: valine--tRNA ligase [candidate division Zixibacteria bacterium]
MPELAKTYDPTQVEDRWYRFWEEAGLFRTEVRPGRRPYCIMMPPPNVTGILHMGHALQDSIQDALIRYHRMKGYEALWMPGTDHAGIATQNVVERSLKERGVSREAMGREAFLVEVWQWKEKHGGIISRQKRRLGDSADWSRERFTMDEGMSRAVAEAFVRLYDEGLVYRGHYIVNWCPRCGTAISDEEVDHRETRGHLWYVRYLLKEGGFLTVATTRPETMLGDTAVAVNPEDERYRHLVGKMAVLPVLGREIPIVADEFVDPKFGTGLVKVTPAHDPNDFEIGRRHNLPSITVIDSRGIMTEAAGPDYSGMDRFEAREALVEQLTQLELLEKIEDHTHAVGHCDRCKTVIEPYLSQQWFVRMKPLAEPAVAAVKEGRIKFVPPRWEKVYLSWLDEIRDWCISRQLWWGHRLPVYTCADCGHEFAAVFTPEKCPICGSTHLEQDPDVLDTWFSSWLWPFSTLGWPEENDAYRYFYPTQVLVSGYDIIFFWIARMIMAGLKFTGKDPFDTVYITGMVKDEQGRWMSKSLGNGIDPLEMIEKYGADAVRYSLVVLTTEGQDIKLAPSRFEMGRNFANKIWNAARFLLMQERPERFTRQQPESLELADRWILSRLQNMLATVEDRVGRYRLNEALLAIYDFTWHDFCDWYLELIKPRLYDNPDAAQREGVLALAFRVFEKALRALHPFMPFVTEELWQQVAALPGLHLDTLEPKSVMVQQYPIPDRDQLDIQAELHMNLLQDVITAVRNIRAEMGVPPSKKATLVLWGNPEKAGIVQGQGGMLQRLAGIDQLLVTEAKQSHAASAVVGDLEIFIPLEGLIDLDVERARLDKEIARQEGLLKGIQGKLANGAFVANAPAEVVEKERQKLADIQATLEKLQRNRRSLE